MKGKYIYIVLASILLLGGGYFLLFNGKKHLVSSSPQERDYQEIINSGGLRVLTSYSAYSREDRKSKELNLFIDFIQKNKGLNVKLKKENSRPLALQKLISGDIDLIAEKIVLTTKIDTANFTAINEEYCEPIYLVQRKDSLSIKSHFDLGGKEICLPKDSELKLFVEHLSEEIAKPLTTKIDPLYGTEQLILKVLDGKVDYTLCSAEEARYYSEQFPSLDISLPISFSLRRAWLVRKSSKDLCDSLNKWVKEFHHKK